MHTYAHERTHTHAYAYHTYVYTQLRKRLHTSVGKFLLVGGDLAAQIDRAQCVHTAGEARQVIELGHLHAAPFRDVYARDARANQKQ